MALLNKGKWMLIAKYIPLPLSVCEREILVTWMVMGSKGGGDGSISGGGRDSGGRGAN